MIVIPKNNINNYFTNETMKNYAQQVYEDSKKLGNYEEVVNRVRRVLRIDLTQYLNKDLIDILEDMYKKFTKDYSNSDVSFSNASLILVFNRYNQ
jgi:predicted outer membrane protein